MTDDTRPVAYKVLITADTPSGPLELSVSGQCDAYDRIGDRVADVLAQFFAALRVVNLDPCWEYVLEKLGPTVGLPDDLQFLAFLHHAWPELTDQDYRGWYRITIDHAQLRDALESDSTDSNRWANRLAFISRHARAKGMIVSGDHPSDVSESPPDSD